MNYPKADWESADGAVRLYRGDCLEVMGALPDDCIDALLTDPPYCSGSISEAARTAAKGQGLRSHNLSRFGWFIGDNMGTAGLAWLLRNVASDSVRLIRGDGSALIFCDWRMMPNLAPAIESVGLRYQGLIVWDKQQFGLGTGFRCQHELIMHFTCGSPAYHNKATGNVIRTNRVRGDDREHQTQKPAELMQSLLKVVTPFSGTALDPFMGSGTTGVACAQTGRRFIGIERDPAYFDIAVKRISEALAQPQLFTTEETRREAPQEALAL